MERDVTDKVLSDVHVFTPHSVVDNSVKAVTRFYFSLPLELENRGKTNDKTNEQITHDEGNASGGDDVDYDDDGDMVVVRKPLMDNKMVITIEHMMETLLDDVGLQVWQGCLLLCDFILHLNSKFKDTKVLDLGAGVGLTSIVAGLLANSVIVTDVGKDVLQMAQDNIALNKPLLGEDCSFYVRELDWCRPLDVETKFVGEDGIGYELTQEDKQLLKDVSVILAAEVIYDPDLTDAFFTTITHLMSKPPKKTLYIALEKRMVFTVDDLDVVSPAYDHFQEKLEELSAVSIDGVTFSYSKIPCNFPQYFIYERHKQLGEDHIGNRWVTDLFPSELLPTSYELWEVVSSVPD